MKILPMKNFQIPTKPVPLATKQKKFSLLHFFSTVFLLRALQANLYKLSVILQVSA
jgi:hypothetical protein